MLATTGSGSFPKIRALDDEALASAVLALGLVERPELVVGDPAPRPAGTRRTHEDAVLGPFKDFVEDAVDLDAVARLESEAGPGHHTPPETVSTIALSSRRTPGSARRSSPKATRRTIERNAWLPIPHFILRSRTLALPPSARIATRTRWSLSSSTVKVRSEAMSSALASAGCRRISRSIDFEVVVAGVLGGVADERQRVEQPVLFGVCQVGDLDGDAPPVGEVDGVGRGEGPPADAVFPAEGAGLLPVGDDVGVGLLEDDEVVRQHAVVADHPVVHRLLEGRELAGDPVDRAVLHPALVQRSGDVTGVVLAVRRHERLGQWLSVRGLGRDRDRVC